MLNFIQDRISAVNICVRSENSLVEFLDNPALGAGSFDISKDFRLNMSHSLDNLQLREEFKCDQGCIATGATKEIWEALQQKLDERQQLGSDTEHSKKADLLENEILNTIFKTDNLLFRELGMRLIKRGCQTISAWSVIGRIFTQFQKIMQCRDCTFNDLERFCLAVVKKMHSKSSQKDHQVGRRSEQPIVSSERDIPGSHQARLSEEDCLEILVENTHRNNLFFQEAAEVTVVNNECEHESVMEEKRDAHTVSQLISSQEQALNELEKKVAKFRNTEEAKQITSLRLEINQQREVIEIIANSCLGEVEPALRNELSDRITALKVLVNRINTAFNNRLIIADYLRERAYDRLAASPLFPFNTVPPIITIISSSVGILGIAGMVSIMTGSMVPILIGVVVVISMLLIASLCDGHSPAEKLRQTASHFASFFNPSKQSSNTTPPTIKPTVSSEKR